MNYKGSSSKDRSLSIALKELGKSRVFSFLKNSFLDVYVKSFKNIETVYGMEITENYVKVVGIDRKKDKSINISFEKEPIPKSSAQESDNFSEALSSVLTRAKYNGEPVFINISGFDFMNKIIETESTKQSPEEWIISNRDRIFPPTNDEEDVAFVYSILSEENQKRTILFTIYRKSVLYRLTSNLEKYHVNVGGLYTGSSALYEYLIDKGLLSIKEKTVLIVLRDSHAEVTVFRDNNPFFVTEIPLGIDSTNTNIGQAAVNLNTKDFVEEIEGILSLSTGDSRATEDIGILLVGDEKLVSMMKPGFKEKGFEMIELPGEDLQYSHLRLFPFIQKSVNSHVTKMDLFHSGLGKKHLNLKHIQKVFNYSTRFFLIVFIIFFLSNVGFGIYELANKTRMEEFQSKITILNEHSLQNKKLEERLETLRSVKMKKSNLSFLLFEISRLSPEKLWLRTLTTEEQHASSDNGGKIELGGLSTSREQVTEFLSNLEHSEYFKEIELEFLDKVSQRERSKIPRRYRDLTYKFKIDFLTKF